MDELRTLRYFFLTLDTEIDRIIESEDMLLSIESGYNPDTEPDPQVRALDELYEPEYWEDLHRKFHHRFYAAVVLLTVSVLEAGLMRLSRYLVANRQLPISSDQVRGSILDQFRVIARLVRWPLPKQDSWKRIENLYQVRNALIHEGGRPLNLPEARHRGISSKLRDIAKAHRGLRVEDIFEPMGLDQILKAEHWKKGKKHEHRRPAQPAGVVLIVEREFCSDAMEDVSRVITDVFKPLLAGSARPR